jgi:hypothetical protein
MSLTRSVERAFDAGELLIEAKRQLQHGQWLPWLRDHVEISERTAQRYMRLTGNREIIEANATTLSDLSFNGALALLTTSTSAAEKTVMAVESSESIQDKAEAARRQVLFDAIGREGKTIMALKKKCLPAGWVRKPCPEIDEIFNGLMETIAEAGDEYDHAVECGNHEDAFALVSWLHDTFVDLRSMCQDIVNRGQSL